MALIQSSKDNHYLTFDDEKHRYTLDGQRVPGATTFGKGGYPTSEALTGWMIGQGSNYTAVKIKQLIEAKENPHYPTNEELKQIIKESKQAHRAVAEEAANIGTIVHDFAYLTELGRTREALQMLSEFEDVPQWTEINNGIKKFEEWKAGNKDVIVATEAIVASVEEQYGGKFDRLATRDGKLVLSDFKTSNGFYVDQFIQLGAYSKAIKEWLGLNVEAYEILRFGKEKGEFETMLIDNQAELQAFIDQAILCRRTYKFKLKWDSDKRFKWMGGTKNVSKGTESTASVGGV